MKNILKKYWLLIVIVVIALFVGFNSFNNKQKDEETIDNNKRHVIENDYLKVEVSELGATLTKFIVKDLDRDIVLGFDNDEDYLKNNFCVGATIGRNANKIGNAQFELNGVTYQLSANENGNQLHGGVEGFNRKYFEVVSKTDDEIVLSYYSKDLEEGFPGNLELKVRYKLDGNNLIYEYSGTSDKDTILNVTNHSYFNLGDENILDEYLYINTDKYAPVDENCLTLDEVLDVKRTGFDFTEKTRIDDNIDKVTVIDNNYVFENLDDKLMCQLSNNDLSLSIYSDLPDMHVFAAHNLYLDYGKNGNTYEPYEGLAMECQFFPNGINYGDKYILPILKQGETMTHYIRYEVNKK